MNQKNKTGKSLNSCLLIAMPQLDDAYFHQTVSLITEFTEKGAMGFVLNRPQNAKIEGFSRTRQSKSIDLSNLNAYWGGPVHNDSGFVLHENADYASDSLFLGSNIYMSGSSKVLNELIDRKDQPELGQFRLFLGYSSWESGQLEDELTDGSWLTKPLDPKVVFSPHPKRLWQKNIASFSKNLHQFSVLKQKFVH